MRNLLLIVALLFCSFNAAFSQTNVYPPMVVNSSVLIENKDPRGASFLRLQRGPEGRDNATISFGQNNSYIWHAGLLYNSGNLNSDFHISQASVIHDNTGKLVRVPDFTITANGNVGIGNATPTSKLSVFQSSNSFSALLLENNGGQGLGLQINAGAGGSDYSIIDAMTFTGVSRFYVRGDGNVGIGTRNPQANLQVGEGTGDGLISVGGYSFLGSIRSTGHIFMGSNVYAKYNSSNEDGVVRVKSATPSGFSMIQSGGDGKITFYGKAGQVNADEQANSLNNLGLFVDGSKGVGIGTTSLGNCKLAVEGTIGAREVVVLAPGAAWPDYVFNSGYKLRSLEEIERYVSSEKHLPDVPSAEAVAKDGVNLGEMNAILLRKVEELTLHLIEQNKANELQNRAIEVLRQEIATLKK